MERGEPAEMREGAQRGRAARWHVASQLAAHIVSADLTGSREFVGLRVRGFADAERSGDLYVVRSALMDLAGASAAYVCQIDMQLPEAKRATAPSMLLLESLNVEAVTVRHNGSDPAQVPLRPPPNTILTPKDLDSDADGC